MIFLMIFHQQNNIIFNDIFNDIFMIFSWYVWMIFLKESFSCFSSWKTVLFCINIFLKILERNEMSVRQLTAKSLLFNCTVIFLRVTLQSRDFKLLSVTFQSSPLNQVFLFQSFLVHACIFQAYVFPAAVFKKNLEVPIVTIIEFEQPCGSASILASLTM